MAALTMTRLVQLWWYPVLGVCMVAWALLTHDPNDSHLRMAALTAGAAIAARAERSFYRTRNEWKAGQTAEQEAR